MELCLGARRGAFYVADPVNLKASFTYPATSLITFLFQPFGPWAEWACLAAIDTLALACLAAASALPRERWAGGVLVFAAGFLLPFFFSATPTGSYAAQYVNAMADLPLAMLFGGTLCLYFTVGRRKIAYWLVALPLAVLTLTKDICFAYGLIAAFLIGLDLWLAADEPCRKAFPKALLRAGALAVIVLAAFSSWGRYTAAVTPTADTAAPGQTAITFTDMPSSPEFVESITWAVENGITTGMYDGQFWPDYTCNISQILTFIWRMSGSPEPAGENPFRDVPNGKWYAAAAVWAHEKGIASGDTLHPDAPCTRAMTVTYLWRLAGSPPESDSPFSDVKSTDNYAAAVAWGAANGIIKGITPTIFGPYNTCTRAHIVTFLHRYSASLLTEAPAET